MKLKTVDNTCSEPKHTLVPTRVQLLQRAIHGTIEETWHEKVARDISILASGRVLRKAYETRRMHAVQRLLKLEDGTLVFVVGDITAVKSGSRRDLRNALNTRASELTAENYLVDELVWTLQRMLQVEARTPELKEDNKKAAQGRGDSTQKTSKYKHAYGAKITLGAFLAEHCPKGKNGARKNAHMSQVAMELFSTKEYNILHFVTDNAAQIQTSAARVGIKFRLRLKDPIKHGANLISFERIDDNMFQEHYRHAAMLRQLRDADRALRWFNSKRDAT